MNQFSLGTAALAFGCLVLVVCGVFLVRRLRVVFGTASVNRFEAASFTYVERPPLRPTPEPVEPAAARTETSQAKPDEPAKIEPEEEPSAPAISAHLSKQELITLLAMQKDADGKYTYSSNRIVAFVGGTAAEVKALVATIRTPQAVPAEPQKIERGKSLRRPENGWG